MAFLGTGRLHCQITCFFAALARFHGLGKIHHVFLIHEASTRKVCRWNKAVCGIARGISESGDLGFIAAIGSTTVPQGGNEASECNFILNLTEFVPGEQMHVSLIPPTHFTRILHVDKNNHLHLRGSCSDSCYHTTAWSANAWQWTGSSKKLRHWILASEPMRTHLSKHGRMFYWILLYSTKNEVGRTYDHTRHPPWIALPNPDAGFCFLRLDIPPAVTPITDFSPFGLSERGDVGHYQAG